MASLRLSVVQDSSPDASWIDRLLDSVSIRSIGTGRIRFHLGFKADEILADALRREVGKLDGVKLDSYSVRTRNALITYDPARVDEVTVVTAVLRGIREFARVHGECDLEHHHHENERTSHSHAGHDHGPGEEDCDHDHSATATDAGIRKELLKLVVTGGALGYLAYRKIRGRPVAFSGNPLLDVASIITIASGYSIFRAGVDSVQKQKKATDDTLIGLAVLATILMGESLTGLSVVWLINLGRLLEAITLKRSRTAIKELMDVAPKEAWLVDEESNRDSTKTPVEKLRKGQIIRIFHGEKVPLDGKIVRGTGLLKEAFITGESLPREKISGESVYAGSLLEQGEIDIEITNLVHDTVVARMIDAIENVRDQKAPIEKIGNRFASQFVPISIGLAGVTLLLTGDLRRAITMLVIACPCAAGLATPTAVSASIGQAARKGVLIKGGTHIEAAARIDTVIFDKTGTLTSGEPGLRRFVATDAGRTRGEELCLRIAASAERHSTHPMGLALVREASRRGIELLGVDSHKGHPGLGVTAGVDGKKVLIGNRRFLEMQGVSLVGSALTETSREAGESLLYFAVDGVLEGVFVIQDSIRPEAIAALTRLRSLGVTRVLLASGDQKAVVEHVARELHIGEFHAELLPAEKLELVARLRKAGRRVAMVGDGVNDAQALAEADLSIAMGGGRCDIAIEAADVTLARGDLHLVAETLDISRKTLRTIYQNFAAAVGINAGGLVVTTFGKLSPFSAAIVHNASTMAVVLNSMKLGKQVAGSSPLQLLKEVKL